MNTESYGRFEFDNKYSLQKMPKNSDCSSRVFLPTPQIIGSTETYYRHKLYTTLKINMYFSLLHSPSDISRKKKRKMYCSSAYFYVSNICITINFTMINFMNICNSHKFCPFILPHRNLLLSFNVIFWKHILVDTHVY